MYEKGGCRCTLCRAAKARSVREYAARFKEANGYSRWRAYKNPENAGTWIGKRRRYAIYERDSFTCGICADPVDMSLHWNADMAASLDHIKPRSHGGGDESENLRMAHRVCNSLRQAPLELVESV